MNQKKQRYLLNEAEKAGNLLKEHVDQDDVVRIISHNDSDGLSSAGIICNAITKLNGKFHVTIVPRLREGFIKKLYKEKYNLFFFCDMGSAALDSLKKIKKDVIVADHHQIPADSEEEIKNITHINPHLYGIDGTKEISASGVSYLTIKEMDNKNLSGLALVGAFGDMQGVNGFEGINKMILDEGIEVGALEIHEDLKLAYKNEEPIYKSLAYTINPVLPGLTGDLEGSMAFLEKMGVSYGIKFSDLSNEERDILKEELIKINPKIFGPVYNIPREIPPLKNIEDYATILDACGKNKKYGIGLSICMGDNKESVDDAMRLVKKYRENLVKGIDWIKKEGSVKSEYIQHIYTEDKRKKSLMGTLASIGMELGYLDPQKPVIAISKMDNVIKISGRGTDQQVKNGVNLGKALDDASKSFNGTGGGHNIAAGAVVPYKDMDNFLNLLNQVIEEQMKN
ncbi:MAG: DHHA1 domain-containing protein [Methanomicrobiales archaeon]